MDNNALKEKIMSDLLDYASVFRMKLIRELLDDVNGKMVVDIGSGRGSISFLLWFLGARVHSVDVSTKALQETRSIRSLGDRSAAFDPHLCRGDAMRLPFMEGIFDIVCCLETLGLLPDDRTAIKEIERVTKPGGIVILAVPYDIRVTGKEKTFGRNRRYSLKTLKELLYYRNLHLKRVIFWSFPVLELLDKIKVRNVFAALGLLIETLSNKNSSLPNFRNLRNSEAFVHSLVRFYQTRFWLRAALPLLLRILESNRLFRNLTFLNSAKRTNDVFLILRKTE